MDNLSLFSRLTPEPRANISNNQWYSADSIPSDDVFMNQQQADAFCLAEKEEIFRRAYQRDQKDAGVPHRNLQVVPELTLEESQIISGKTMLMNPLGLKKGQNIWAPKAFLQSASAATAVEMLQREQQKNNRHLLSIQRDQLSSHWNKSSNQSELKMVTPLHGRLFHFQQSNAGLTSQGSQQFTANFNRENSSAHYLACDRASSMQNSVKQSNDSCHYKNQFHRFDEFDAPRFVDKN